MLGRFLLHLTCVLYQSVLDPIVLVQPFSGEVLVVAWLYVLGRLFLVVLFLPLFHSPRLG